MFQKYLFLQKLQEDHLTTYHLSYYIVDYSHISYMEKHVQQLQLSIARSKLTTETCTPYQTKRNCCN